MYALARIVGFKKMGISIDRAIFLDLYLVQCVN